MLSVLSIYSSILADVTVMLIVAETLLKGDFRLLLKTRYLGTLRTLNRLMVSRNF